MQIIRSMLIRLLQQTLHTLNGPLGVFINQSTSSGTTEYLWDFDDGNTSTQYSPQHAYANFGIYNVCLQVTNNCGTVSTCTDVNIGNVTGVDELGLESLSIYPNPSTGVLTITAEGNPDDVLISLYSVTGELLRTDLSLNTQSDVSELANGVYFINITASDNTKTVKFIKQ